MRVPSREECYRILKAYEVPAHIVAHCERVAQVATFLARHLREQGEPLDLALIEASGLLHDLTKHWSLKTGENHALSAARELKAMGYPEVAEVVAQHIFLEPGPPQAPIRPEEVVYYADKRVKHTEIVPLRERFEDLRARYGQTASSLERLYRLEELTLRLEQRLFERLPFGPEKIQDLD